MDEEIVYSVLNITKVTVIKFSSFYNIGHEEAFNTIQSGILGQSDNLEKLGINMSEANLEAFALAQGMNKSYSEMNEAEKATLRYNYMLQETSNVQGDFAKNSDSFANQMSIAKLNMQDLSTEVGKILLPIAESAMMKFSELGGELKEAFNSDGITGMAGKFGEVAGEMISEISNLLPKIVDMGVDIIQSLITGIKDNLPTIASGALDIVMTLSNGIIEILPLLLDLGLQVLTELGRGIAENLPALIPTIVDLIISICDMIIENLPLILEVAIEIILALVQGLVNALPTLISEVPRIINSFTNTIYEALPEILKAGIDIIIMLVQGLIESIPIIIENLPQIIMAIINVFTLVNWANIGSNLISNIGTGIESMISNIKTIAQFMAENVTTTIKDLFGSGINIGLYLVEWLKQGIVNGAGNICQAAGNIAISALQAIQSILGWESASSIGSNLIRGLWSGISNMTGWILNLIGGFANSVIKNIKGLFGIHSPSRVMRDQVGKYLAQGIGIGFTDESENIESDMQDSLLNLTSNMRATVEFETSKTSLGMMSSLTSSGSNESTVDNNDSGIFIIKNYMDSDEISEYTYKKVDNQFALAGKRVR